MRMWFSLFNWSAFLLYIFVMSFTPGPNIIISMANASKYGFKKSLQYSAGVFTGFFVLMTLSSYFNLVFFSVLPKIQPVMQVVGTLFMFYLAYQIMTAKEEPEKSNAEKNPHNLPGNQDLFFTAIAFQFINPKGVLYAITVVSTFIIPHYQSHLAFFLFAVLVSLTNFVSTATWASFGVLFNRFLSQYQKPFNLLMGLLLIYSAISMLDLI